MCDSLGLSGLQPARLLCPWDPPGKNTGVGCHFLLQFYIQYYAFFAQISAALTFESSFSWLISPFNIALCVGVGGVYLGLLASQHAPGLSCILILLQVKNSTFIKEHCLIYWKIVLEAKILAPGMLIAIMFLFQAFAADRSCYPMYLHTYKKFHMFIWNINICICIMLNMN